MVPDSNATTLFIDSARVMARAGRKTAPSRSWECSPSRTTSPWRHSQGSSRPSATSQPRLSGGVSSNPDRGLTRFWRGGRPAAGYFSM